jgi:pyruvate formate lyase activating enzyme
MPVNSITGNIFNIQRFSVNDGPGIRTIVFLKGCPLHCSWCHNPESVSSRQELMLSESRCLRCGNCFEACPNGAIVKKEGGFITLREKCRQCGTCIDVCFSEARTFIGSEMTVEEVMIEILKDVVFYDRAKGGVTFSGGEPLLQHEFLLAILKECKASSIHTTVDTAGFARTDKLKEVSDYVDLFLYDLKTLDDTKHREYTGVSNMTIIQNLKLLSSWGNNIIVRTPVIPGFNDDPESIGRIARFVASLQNIREMHLLPYHATGSEKHRRLGTHYRMNGTKPPSAEKMAVLTKEIQKMSLTVSIGG